MTHSSRLVQLANKIQSQVTEIRQYLNESGQSEPTFDGSAQPVDFDGIDDVRSLVLDNLIELQDLLSTPREQLQSKFATEYVSRQAIDRFHIIQSVPIDGSITYEELAKATNLPVKLLRRFVRHAMTQRIFYEPQPDHVAHTQSSRLLAENSHVRDYFGTISNEVWPASTRICDAVAQYPNSNKRNESGYFVHKGVTFYEALSADPTRQARHDNAYAAFAGDRAFSFRPIIDGLDWAALGTSTVVDVGGGSGTISKALAANFPHLNFIVQDTPDVLAARPTGDEDYGGRVKFMSHDFFAPQPVKDAAVYFFRRVMMDWSDDQIAQILRNLKPALKVGATVLIVDSQIPEPGTCPLWMERRFRNSDLIGLAIGNASIREIGEWAGIIEKAGPGFEVRKVEAVKNTEVALIAAVWVGE